jgi:hypothetical protein
MSVLLDTARFVWDVVKDGAKLEVEGKVVTVVPKGTTKEDHSHWEGPVSYPENYHEVSSLLGVDLANFTLTANWEYNGVYIANFNVLAEGTVDVLSSLDVKAETLQAHLNDDGVAELPYHIHITFKNLTGGAQRKTYRAVAAGNGAGRSVG